MTENEFRELKHGDKISGLKESNFIVHNNHRSGPGMVVAVRTEVIYARHCGEWSLVRKAPARIKMALAEGIYEVQIVRKI